MTVFVAALAGSVGAVARYTFGGVVQRRTGADFPWGTATVNLTGAFILGLIVGVGGDSLWWVAAAGFTGGLTTFSTWMVETVGLGMAPRPSLRAMMNLTVVTVAGVAVAALGYWLVH